MSQNLDDISKIPFSDPLNIMTRDWMIFSTLTISKTFCRVSHTMQWLMFRDTSSSAKQSVCGENTTCSVSPTSFCGFAQPNEKHLLLRQTASLSQSSCVLGFN